MGSGGRKTYFPQNKVQKREESPSIPNPVRGDHRECESFHSPGNSQMTDLLFYMHRAKEEKVHKKNEVEKEKEGL